MLKQSQQTELPEQAGLVFAGRRDGEYVGVSYTGIDIDARHTHQQEPQVPVWWLSWYPVYPFHRRICPSWVTWRHVSSFVSHREADETTEVPSCLDKAPGAIVQGQLPAESPLGAPYPLQDTRQSMNEKMERYPRTLPTAYY